MGKLIVFSVNNFRKMIDVVVIFRSEDDVSVNKIVCLRTFGLLLLFLGLLWNGIRCDGVVRSLIWSFLVGVLWYFGFL